MKTRAHVPDAYFGDVTLVCFTGDTWPATQWNTRHQVLSRLCRYFNLVWVNPQPQRSEVLKKLTRRLSQCGNGDASGLVVHDSVIPQLFRWQPLVSAARLAHSIDVQRTIRRRATTNIVVAYVWRPEYCWWLDLKKFDAVIYHVDDEYSYSEVDTPLDPREVRLLQRADDVIFHSKSIMAKKERFTSRCHYIPNGVDYALFSEPAAESCDMARIPRPRVGYSGVIKSQLNIGLLLELATKRPNWSFVFVGMTHDIAPKDTDDFRKLCSRPNVFRLGLKPVTALPGYVQHFDVAILPYRVNSYTNFINPLKLHEYLAAGPPVVSSQISSVEDLRDVVRVADESVDGWLTALESALEEPSATEARELRRSVAARHDWNDLVFQIATVIATRLKLPPPSSPLA